MSPDPGLQPERTALAWRRTALSVLIGSAAGARILAPHLGAGAVVLGVLGCGFGAWVHLVAGRSTHRRSAAPLAVTAGFCLLLGAVAASFVVLHGLRGILTSR